MSYLDNSGVSYLWSKIKVAFAPKSHVHAASDITSGTLPGTSIGIDGSTIKTDASGNLYADVPTVEVDDDTIKINAQGKIYVNLTDADGVQY